jgi:polyhydroxyalkanoate synthase
MDVARIWSPFSQSELEDRAPVAAKAALEKRSFSADVKESVDPPASIDRLLRASMGRFTLGLSPYALWLAYADWAIHLCGSPGKLQQLAERSARNTIRFLNYYSNITSKPACRPCVEALPQDQRFRSEAWQQWPFNLIYQAFLLNQEWWHSAMTGVGGVSRHHEQVVAFMTRQLLDTVSPVNFIATNPEVLAATLREGGQNLVRGAITHRSVIKATFPVE